MSRFTQVSAATLLFLAYASVLQGQTGGSRWSFALTAARSLGSAQIEAAEDALHRTNFDATEPGICLLYVFCIGPSDRPASSRGYGLAFDGQYQLTSRVAIKAFYFHSTLGSTEGYHANHWAISIGTSASGVGLLATANFFGVLSVGAGPAYMKVVTTSKDEEFSKTRFGVVLEGSARFPSQTQFFAELQFQRRLFASHLVGPLSPRALEGHTAISPQWLPAFRQQLSHQVFGLGAGIRL